MACKYCIENKEPGVLIYTPLYRKGNPLIDERKVTIQGTSLVTTIIEDNYNVEHIAVEIKFCPMCGEQLKRNDNEK